MATRKKPESLEAPSSLQKMRDPIEATERMPDDWLALIQNHHALIKAAFDEVLSTSNSPVDVRQQRFRRLGLLLTAHCVAEENVIYPALAMHGLQTESDKLYLDQAHAKVMNAVLDMADDKGSAGWLEKARELKEVVLQHATQDEEADLYPRLQAELDATTALKLGAAYRREFLSVKPS
jgi:hemerythrin superfamily protein